jgi:hypothetical protein
MLTLFAHIVGSNSSQAPSSQDEGVPCAVVETPASLLSTAVELSSTSTTCVDDVVVAGIVVENVLTRTDTTAAISKQLDLDITKQDCQVSEEEATKNSIIADVILVTQHYEETQDPALDDFSSQSQEAELDTII